MGVSEPHTDQPSAPPLYPAPTPPVPGYPLVPQIGGQNGMMQQPAVGMPATPAPTHSQLAPPQTLAHPSAVTTLQPPAVHVVEHHTYVHLPDEPLIAHSSCAAPRQITCPACFSAGPTVVQRQSGCCAYLACFGLCWVCCPLFWLPFVLDCDKDVVHRCGSCGTEVARVRPCA